jgi:hypothetical protein
MNSKPQDRYDATVVRGGSAGAAIGAPRFHFDCKLYGPDGELKDQWSADNLVTTEGRNSLLDIYFDAAAQITTWYLGLISSVGWTAVAAGDVAAQINGTNQWDECGAVAQGCSAPDYDTPAGTDRGTITFGEPAAGSLVSSSTVDFTFSESGTVKGAFIASNITQGSTAGVLYSAATFTGDKVVGDNDQLKVTVTVSFTAS